VGLGIGITTVAQADIYEFSYTGLFTMLDSSGKALQNTSYPYYGDTTWGYGNRTQISGTTNFDTVTGAGTATVNPFNFFSGGSATASGVFFQSIGGGLMLGNMNFNWNGSDITTNIVLDGSGLFAAVGGGVSPLIGAVLDQDYCTSSGACATPASDGIKKGNYPIGPTPIATSPFNVSGSAGFGTTLGQLSLGTDDGIGGTPMDNGPFSGFNANFDFLSTTVTGYNDTTKPVLTFSPSAQVSIDLNAAFDENTPGVVVNCADNADGSGTLNTDGSSSNTSLSFTVNASDLVALDTSTSGAYTVRYNCSDNAGARTAVDDPNNPGTTTVPVNNISDDVIFNVIVADPDAPVITILNDGQPTIHEACTVYNDAGATATDPQEGDLTGAIIPTDVNGIFGQTLLAGTPDATVEYNVSDTNGSLNNVGTTLQAVKRIRTVKTVDSLAPIITINGFSAGNATTTIEVTEQGTYAIPDATSLDANSCSAVTSGGAVATADTINFVVPDGQDSVSSDLTYADSDVFGNSASVTLTVVVERSKPVITLLDEGGSPVSVGDFILPVGNDYSEYGMNIHDVQGGDLTGIIATGSAAGTDARLGQGDLTYTITGTVDSNTVGDYVITYTATDSDGYSSTITRNVKVADGVGIGNFTMLDPNGIGVGGTNDVTYVWDGRFSDPSGTLDTDGYTVPSDPDGVMTIASPEPFSGANWTAKEVRVYQGPVKLKFDVTCRDADSKANPRNI